MKVRSITILVGILSIHSASGQTFQHFLGYLNALPERQRQAAADSFVGSHAAFPIAENDTTVHFIFTGEVNSVALAGDATNWEPALPFDHVTGTDLWYLTRTYEPEARLDYKIVVNDTLWMLDPLNPDTCMSGYGPNSELRMPGYPPLPEVTVHPENGLGTLLEISSTSTFLENSRTIRVYLPAGYDSGGPDYPMVLFHDGLEFLTLANAKNILDYLIGQRIITPVIGVFVPPVNREQEYCGQGKEGYRRYVAEELMPLLCTQFRISRDPRYRSMVGISNGGNIGLWIGINNPELFGRVAAMSSNVERDLFNAYEKGNNSGPELYLDMGTYDIPALKELALRFTTLLKAKGYTFSFHQFPEGHSWGNWEGHLRLPLVQFFPFETDRNR